MLALTTTLGMDFGKRNKIKKICSFSNGRRKRSPFSKRYLLCFQRINLARNETRDFEKGNAPIRGIISAYPRLQRYLHLQQPIFQPIFIRSRSSEKFDFFPALLAHNLRVFVSKEQKKKKTSFARRNNGFIPVGISVFEYVNSESG